MVGKYTNEIVIGNNNWKKVNQLIKILVEEGYVTMVSVEEDLIILNFTETFSSDYAPLADRNEVVFMSLSEFEDKYTEVYDRNSEEV